MTTHTQKIKSRGYWKVVVRPLKFLDSRIDNISELFPIVRKCSVQIRGWDFPHIDHRDPPLIGTDFVMQEINWRNHQEHWRLYQSGLFRYLGGFTVDWMSSWENVAPQPHKTDPGSLLGVGDVVARFAEFFGFVSAFANTEAADKEMVVEIHCVGLRDRELWVDSSDRYPFLPDQYVCQIDNFPQRSSFTRERLIADADALALAWSRELFRRFGWDPPMDQLESTRQTFR